MRRDYEQGAAGQRHFQPAGAGADDVPRAAAPLVLEFDHGADRNRGAGRKIRQGQGEVELDALTDRGGLAGLALGEIGGLLTVGVPLVLGPALLADCFVPGEGGGPRRAVKLLPELLQDGGAEI